MLPCNSLQCLAACYTLQCVIVMYSKSGHNLTFDITLLLLLRKRTHSAYGQCSKLGLPYCEIQAPCFTRHLCLGYTITLLPRQLGAHTWAMSLCRGGRRQEAKQSCRQRCWQYWRHPGGSPAAQPAICCLQAERTAQSCPMHTPTAPPRTPGTS